MFTWMMANGLNRMDNNISKLFIPILKSFPIYISVPQVPLTLQSYPSYLTNLSVRVGPR
ncbi:hypothetical protein Csa_005577, partial [Cucumis sativus]